MLDVELFDTAEPLMSPGYVSRGFAPDDVIRNFVRMATQHTPSICAVNLVRVMERWQSVVKKLREMDALRRG